MNIEKAQKVVLQIEAQLIQTARTEEMLNEVQPLTDSLAQLRIGYNRYRRDPSLYERQDTPEDQIALNLIIEALAMVRSMLILPAMMISEINTSGIHELTQEKNKRKPPQGETIPGILPRDLGDAPKSLSRLFDEIVQELRGYIARVDGIEQADIAAETVKAYFGGQEG